MDIGRAIEQYHSGLDMFALGDPEPIKAMYARGEDVLLANPFGGSSRGWDAVSQALDFASSKFRDGSPVRASAGQPLPGARGTVLRGQCRSGSR
jgi:hypothetical protein